MLWSKVFCLILLVSVSVSTNTYFVYDDVAYPLNECLYFSDGTRYFSCNSDGTTATVSFYDGGTDCTSSSATTTDYTSSEATFDCSGNIGYGAVGLWINNAYFGQTTCSIDTTYSTKFATDVCHYNSYVSAYAKYTCDSTPTLTVSVYGDSSCSVSLASTSYTDCFKIGWWYGDPIGYGARNFSLFAKPSSCYEYVTTTESPTTTTEKMSAANTTAVTTSDMMSTTDITTTDITTTDMTTTDMTTTDMTTTADMSTTEMDSNDVSIDLSSYEGKYFNYETVGNDFPMPIDLCIPIEVEVSGSYTTTYGYGECSNDGSQLTLTKYSSSDCSGDALNGTITYSVANGDEFECDGYNNYVAMGLNILSGCSFEIFSLYTATGRCFEIDGAYYATSCSESSGVITMWQFGDSECGSVTGYTDLDVCSTLSGFEYGGYTLYLDSNDCYLESTDTSTSDDTTNDNNSSSTTTTTTTTTTDNDDTSSGGGTGYSTTDDDDDDDNNNNDDSTDISRYEGRYFNYEVVGNNVPMPIDLCIPINVEVSGMSYTTTYGYGECSNDGTQLTLTKYSTSDCSGDALNGTIEYSVANEDEFECDGYNNYAAIGLNILSDQCTVEIFALYAATGRCFQLNGDYYALTCSEANDVITMWQYGDSDCQNETGSISLDDCVTLDGFEYGGYTFYLASSDCYLEEYTVAPSEAPVMAPTSAPIDGNAAVIMKTSTFVHVAYVSFVASLMFLLQFW